MAGMIRGIEAVQANLARACQQMKDGAERGLVSAAIYIGNDMENTPPLTPVKTGNMRKSFFVVSRTGAKYGKAPSFIGETAGMLSARHASILSTALADVQVNLNIIKVDLGYSAHYTTFVHEMMQGINWTRPGSGPKWFSAALNRNRGVVREIIAMNVRLKHAKRV